MSILNYIPDIMHCLYLGLYQYFFASVLEYLVFHVMGGTPAKNMDDIWQAIQKSYQVS